MRHGSLFNGIGGFQLAAQWMGWENVFSCEIDEWCNKVTKQHFPNCIQHGDIKQTDFTIYRGKIDILTGGFPCQPFSMSGKRKGTEDNRYLWPEMLRTIGEIQPTYIVGENVYGLVNWSKGLVFEQVQVDLENEGYQVGAYILPACSVKAPHRRERIWFVANRGGEHINLSIQQRRQEKTSDINLKRNGNGRTIAHTNKSRLSKRFQSRERSISQTEIKSERSESSRVYPADQWKEFPTQSPLCRRDDGISHRMDRIKGLGNAIVPQVAYEIFKAIETYQQLSNGS